MWAITGTYAQDSSAFKLSAYAEVYFGYDLAAPENGERPAFLYNHKRHQEFNANLVLVQGAYERDGVRGAVGLMAGNYVQYNMAAEPDGLRNIYEARVGLRLSKERELWLDAGIFPSHIGFESAIGMDCMTLTRSLVAENSPYYEAGAVLSYRPEQKLTLSLLALNGWQAIQREPANRRPAFGTQLRFDDGEGTILNWSTFVGSMGPDSVGLWRIYNNFYSQVEGDDFGMVLGIDVGLQERPSGAENANELNAWMTMVGIYRQRIHGRWWGTGRIEFFMDEDDVLIPGPALLGLSLGLDLRLSERALWRIEGRLLGSNEERFANASGMPSQMNTVITTALALRF